MKKVFLASFALFFVINLYGQLIKAGEYNGQPFMISRTRPFKYPEIPLEYISKTATELQARSDANKEYYYAILNAVSEIQDEVVKKELLDLIDAEVGDIVKSKSFLHAKDRLMELENKILKHLTRAVQNAERSQKYEQTLEGYWKTKGIDELEGIYEEVLSDNDISMGMAKYELALIKTDGGYDLLYIYGAGSVSNWKPGDIKASMTATTTPYRFNSKWYMADKAVSDKLYITFGHGSMKIIWNDGKPDNLFLKLYPSANDNVPQLKSVQKSSGTGFAISSNGIIVTNYHVVDGASTIKVRGVNFDFGKTYSAKVLVSDANNDLALIQIEDAGFSTLGALPYSVKSKLADAGENIFVLGYPLRATMGDEIKLTNGIVSSRTGFQGDASSYQISAPVQPGNSGGPLFDNSGNLIGIINAKHTGAENASYAVKSSYLTNLLELLPNQPTLQTTNLLTGKSLSQQVELVKKFIYIIEIQESADHPEQPEMQYQQPASGTGVNVQNMPFSIQIAASTTPFIINNNPDFVKIKQMFNLEIYARTGTDGRYRYFAGGFNTSAEAKTMCDRINTTMGKEFFVKDNRTK